MKGCAKRVVTLSVTALAASLQLMIVTYILYQVATAALLLLLDVLLLLLLLVVMMAAQCLL